jgi:hypothetical protein
MDDKIKRLQEALDAANRRVVECEKSLAEARRWYEVGYPYWKVVTPAEDALTKAVEAQSTARKRVEYALIKNEYGDSGLRGWLGEVQYKEAEEQLLLP